MVSAETAVGRYPDRAIQTMARIAAESDEFAATLRTPRRASDGVTLASPTHALAHTAFQAAREIRARALVVFTHTGYSARLVGKSRPVAPILALTPLQSTCRRLALASAGKKREFVVIGRENPHGYKVAPAKAADKPDETARNFHDKLLRLMPVEIYGKAEVPEVGAPTPSVRLDYFDGGKPIGYVELAKVDAPASSAPPTPSPHGATASVPRTEYFARTEHTPGWVRLANDPSVLADAEKLVAGAP